MKNKLPYSIRTVYCLEKTLFMKKINRALILLLVPFLLTSCLDMRTSSDSGDSSVNEFRDALYSGIFSNGGENVPDDAEFSGFTEAETTAPLITEAEADLLSPVAEPEDKYANVDISFIAAGDNLIHPNLYSDAYNRGNAQKRYDFLPLYQNVAPLIAAADFAYINQETPMAGEAYGYTGWPTFNSPQQLGIDLAEIGFDVDKKKIKMDAVKALGSFEAEIRLMENISAKITVSVQAL